MAEVASPAVAPHSSRERHPLGPRGLPVIGHLLDIRRDPLGFFSDCHERYGDVVAREQYRRCFTEPDMIHATCEDYRAGATYDFKLDEEDRAAGAGIRCPLLALWGSNGLVGRSYDVLGIWRAWANDVKGQAIEGGHFLPEQAPEETLGALRAFLAR